MIYWIKISNNNLKCKWFEKRYNLRSHLCKKVTKLLKLEEKKRLSAEISRDWDRKFGNQVGYSNPLVLLKPGLGGMLQICVLWRNSRLNNLEKKVSLLLSDSETCSAVVHGVTKSWTCLSNWTKALFQYLYHWLLLKVNKEI